MSKSEIQIDENWLDELVTGNLRGDSYRKALQTLDARPHLWRQCAIAFLREQALTQDLKTLAEGNIDWSAVTDSPRQALSSVNVPSLQLAEERRRSVQLKLLQRFAALAALLLVSFSIGWMGAGLRGRSGDHSQRNLTHQAGVMSGLPGNLASGSSARPSVSTLAEPRRTIPQSMVLASDRFMPLDLQVPTQLLELERAGRIRIETTDAIVPVQFDDGTSAIVPVQQFRVVPLLYSY